MSSCWAGLEYIMVKVMMVRGSCRLDQAVSEMSVGAAMRQGKSRHVVAATSACFDVPSTSTRWVHVIQWESRMAAEWSLALTSRRALNRLSIDTPHRPPPACRRRVQSLMLPSSKLRVTLLHLAPTTPLVVSQSKFVLSSARTMSTKPSLKVAEDFLSFVNASPTRMSRAVATHMDTDYR